MNRNIIFRGREPQFGGWVTGCLVANCRVAYIVTLGGYSLEATEVDPDTVQQRTNCYHHGRDVWEGDIYADPAKPGERYTVHYDILCDEFRIFVPTSANPTLLSAPLVYYLATHPELEYVGNIIDLTDNTDKP